MDEGMSLTEILLIVIALLLTIIGFFGRRYMNRFDGQLSEIFRWLRGHETRISKIEGADSVRHPGESER